MRTKVYLTPKPRHWLHSLWPLFFVLSLGSTFLQGPSQPSFPVVRSWLTSGGSQSSAFPMSSLGSSSICSSIRCKLYAGSSTLGSSDASRWAKVTLSSGQPGLSTKRGKIISRDQKKKKYSPSRVVFVGLHFLMWRAHFLLICSQLQKQGEWEQGCFIYPKQFIKQTQGIWDSLWQIKVNSVPFVSSHTYKLFLLKVEEVILMFLGCLQAALLFFAPSWSPAWLQNLEPVWGGQWGVCEWQGKAELGCGREFWLLWGRAG